MIDALKNGRSITLYSIRRLGKTGLIQHVLHKLKKSRKTIPIYIDIYDTLNQKDFVNKICSAVMSALEKKTENFIKNLGEFFGKFRPKISFDTVTGQPTVELDIVTDQEVKLTLSTLFKIVKKQKAQVIITIDEFQQINYYEKSSIAATIRQYIQEQNNVSFIFSGSERNLLLDMFGSPKQALFRTTQMMPLEKIGTEAYKPHIKFHFKQGLKIITDTQIDDILEWTDRHTYYTQYLCHRLYEKVQKKIDDALLEKVKRQILKENELMFQNYKRLLSPQQWKLLRAIGKEHLVNSPTSKAFISKYDLGTHSTVRLSLSTLEQKQLIYSAHNTELDKNEYRVYDLFLARWLQTIK